jgi:hypothetical protein
VTPRGARRAGTDAAHRPLNDVWAYCVADCPAIAFERNVYDPARDRSVFVPTCPYCAWQARATR